MVRAWSAMARVMAWRVHHVAYVVRQLVLGLPARRADAWVRGRD